MKYEIFTPIAIHELGQRTNQEDNIFPIMGAATTDSRLFIVCDGMGGHEKGEVASNLVCQSISQYFQSHQVTSEQGFSDEIFRDALQYAYTQLDKEDDGATRKMGTTLTFLFLHRDGATMAHIGDSRIYHIRPGKGILYQSRDHSLVFELFQAGEITYDEMRTSPQKNIITRAMQPCEENRVRADIVHTTDIQPGDYFYLCTDGMLEQMVNEEINTLFSAPTSDEEKRQRLIEATQCNSDNHSAYLIHIKDVICEQGDDTKTNDEATSRYNAINIIRQRNEEDKQTAPPSDIEEGTQPNGAPLEVEVVGDYVSVVEDSSSTPITLRNPFSFLRLLEALLMFIALALAFYYTYHSFFGGEKETKKTDTIIIIQPDTARSQAKLAVPEKESTEGSDEKEDSDTSKAIPTEQKSLENPEDTTAFEKKPQPKRGISINDISKSLKQHAKQQ